ncbi:cobalt-precorrin-5B (C(1))-methyltransferase CbiD [Spirulina major]|uniref:cobalt-precorrin-5B (C(1))-methyltransferase CbiD n=1 Tax=Spirulina major TaxID=270636 RepID=UPI0009352FC0|nr:cobalt-precorrin-5B (C(1))-methyltransferase CbiD [Spirulina major]
MSDPRAGYTLPVFAAAAALAAVQQLQALPKIIPIAQVDLDLLEPPQRVSIPIEQIAPIAPDQVLAVTRSDPGDNLDLTRDMAIWAIASLTPDAPEPITILGGEGVGKQSDRSPAIYAYAHRLITAALAPHLQGQRITVQLILPTGRRLAERTSNAAFGVIEGLSLLGTTGISQPLSAPGQLTAYQDTLIAKAAQFDTLVFCIGENGLDLARTLGVNPEQQIKTANWLGPMLVTAAAVGLKSLLLFGYHGKLIKLAGGIFHTHHHLADGRLEIFTAHCAQVGVGGGLLRELFASATTEAALQHLRQVDQATGSDWVNRVYGSIAAAVDARTIAYIQKHGDRTPAVGSVLFDRDRHIIAQSPTGTAILTEVCYPDIHK